MSRRPVTGIRQSFVPFHYPGRDTGRLRMLPPGEVRKYKARLGRWWGPRPTTAWLAIGWAGLVGWLQWTSPDGPCRVLAITAAAVLTVAALCLAVHFQMRQLLWVVWQDYPDLCHACGYDMTATPDRCPECGTVPASE